MNLDIKPVVTEKAVMMIESQNTLTFKCSKKMDKKGIRKEIEEIFGVKVEAIKSLIRENQKYFYVKLKKDFLAIDVATKIGMI